MIRLENWSITSKGISPYQAPECIKSYLQGNVHNHPKERWEDGHPITTSSIQNIEDMIATTNSGTEYHLGKPHPDYAKAFPNWKELINK